MPAGRPKRSALRARHRELLEIERSLWPHGLVVAGLDEAGAGPLAGPVVAACVVLDPSRVDDLVGVDDSKRLSEAERDGFAPTIRASCRAFAVAEATVEEIDRINIRQAGLLAMRRAFEAVVRAGVAVGHLLVDARRVPGTDLPQSELIRGDSRSLSIAAASILAKVARDEWMLSASVTFPGYGFERHKGYATPEHQAAIARLGVCALHRRSFAPVREAAQLGLFSAERRRGGRRTQVSSERA